MKKIKDLKIVSNYKIYFAFSAIIIILGLGLAGFRGFNFGIDFTGGTLLEINTQTYLEPEEIKEITDKFDPNIQITYIGEDKASIQLKTTEDFNNEERTELFSEFQKEYGLSTENLLRSEQFGPSVGKEIQTKALLSVIVATIAMLIYVSIRFKFDYGVAAVIALIHDVVFVIAIYSIFNIPINNPFVAAMLTVLGYSMNDTIVIFDRIRENMQNAKRDSFEDVADQSIKQTIARSINTAFTTLLSIAALYILGVDSIKEFTLPLIAGISVGVYSSIFIASPIWVMLNKNNRKRKIQNISKS